MHGKPPPSVPAFIVGTSYVAACDSLHTSRDEILSLLKRNLLKAQMRMKANADKHRREVDLAVGSWAYVKLQPYRQTSLSGSKYHKLSKSFDGPYLILEKVGFTAYKLDLPSYSKIHNVFHCSLLKAHEGPPPAQIDDIPPQSLDNNPLVMPLAILDFQTLTDVV